MLERILSPSLSIKSSNLQVFLNSAFSLLPSGSIAGKSELRFHYITRFQRTEGQRIKQIKSCFY